MSDHSMRHNFVDSIPEHLEPGVLYVSIKFATAAHLCICGCGREVVTPFTPTDWQMTFDGKTISLHPSIGNWSFPCQSHYWVRRNKVQLAPKWTPEQIQAGRDADRFAKTGRLPELMPSTPAAAKQSFWQWVRFWER
jgi:Family of unknown function (DUF6527)